MQAANDDQLVGGWRLASFGLRGDELVLGTPPRMLVYEFRWRREEAWTAS
jgi:hypothetical protein